MTWRDIRIRAAGLAAIGAGVGACLWLRALMAAPPHEPTVLEFALVLASFVFSLGGLMMLLDGAGLFDPANRTARRQGERHRLSSPYAAQGEERDRLQAILARRAGRKRRG
ncbi:hypothetical protein [Sphingomonas sp.]|uniref:hypothetical protein n=1 Tax=Sphingomonas sp. TaxID=28214 RepID=UPI003B3A8B67